MNSIHRIALGCSLAGAALALWLPAVPGQDVQVGPWQAFLQEQGRNLRAGDVPPKTREEWDGQREQLKANLLKAWGGFPEHPCELQPRQLRVLQRDGYRVEMVVFQTMPGVWMTANAYVPDRSGPLPAVLCVHGHWAGAKQDPVVQSRCIGLAKLGFFVLSVDAFGAGERGIGKRLGEYHGEMTGAMLLPVGRPLSGIQVYENQRAVDYLQSRPEVDAGRIGITGASGGGNQTMYAGAMDERFRCVVPTCSVGTYQAYLSAACCMCEVVPGALRFTEEGNVLGLAAHRGLMVTSATRDAFQFSVGEAKKSFARVEAIASLYDGARVRHTVIESPHHYNQPMREAMYGWMTLHLRGQGDGSPIAEPALQTEDPETIRCYPGDTRPDDFVTIPRLAAAEGRRLLDQRAAPGSLGEWQTERPQVVAALDRLLGGTAAGAGSPTRATTLPAGKGVESPRQTIRFESEPGLSLELVRDAGPLSDRLAVLLQLDGEARAACEGELAGRLRRAGWTVAVPQLRGTGPAAVARDRIGNAPDHNSAEWSLWIGRPLAGQWVVDVRRALDALREQEGKLPREIALVGQGSAGIVALCAAALDERVRRVVAIGSLSSYISDQPYRGQRMGVMIPGVLRDVGDVAHLAALVAPRPLTIVSGVTGAGEPVPGPWLTQQFAVTRQVYELHQAGGDLRVRGDDAIEEGLAASPARPPVYAIHRTGTPIQVDGRLDEPAWIAAPDVGRFHFPWYREGRREQTVAKMLWDDEHLYIGHICEDAHITARHPEHDGDVAKDDCFEVMLAPDPARPLVYFNIEWNVIGGYIDNFRPAGPSQPRAKVWDAEGVRVAGIVVGTLNDDSDADTLWQVEVAIPFRNFAKYMPHTPPRPGDHWNLNLNRHGGDTNMQYSQWSPADTPKPSFHTPERFGRVLFSSEIQPFHPRPR